MGQFWGCFGADLGQFWGSFVAFLGQVGGFSGGVLGQLCGCSGVVLGQFWILGGSFGVFLGAVLGQFSGSSEVVLGLVWGSFEDVFGLFWDCFGSFGDSFRVVLRLFWGTFNAVMGLFWGCFGAILELFWGCFEAVLGQFCGCFAALWGSFGAFSTLSTFQGPFWWWGSSGRRQEGWWEFCRSLVQGGAPGSSVMGRGAGLGYQAEVSHASAQPPEPQALPRVRGPGAVCAGELHSLRPPSALCTSTDPRTRRALSISPRVAKRRHPAGCCGASAEPGPSEREPRHEGRVMGDIAQKAAGKHRERESPAALRETSAVGTKGSRAGGGKLSISRVMIIWRESLEGFRAGRSV